MGKPTVSRSDIPADMWRHFGHEPPDPSADPPAPQPARGNVVNISGTPHHHPDPAGGAAYAQAALKDECAQLAATTTGRNHRLNVAAFNLASLVEAGHLTRTEVTEALTAAARIASQRGDHPLTDHEITATIDSGFRGAHDKVGARTIQPRPDTITITEVTAEQLTGKPADTGAGRPTDAENDFWTARPSLDHIYTTALSRMCAPWAVLAHCAARALTGVRPNATLPALIGGRGSLNWFAAVAAPSGGGKGSSAALARELIPDPIRERNMGSGEGIIGAFYRPGTKTEPPEINEAVLFTADEVDTLAAMNNRSGSTTMSILRSGFAGETLGFSYITRGRDVHLEAHSYRMTLVISVQPARAGALLDDHGGGTPQRFQWFPGTDPRITDTPEHVDVYPLVLPSPSNWLYPKTITIPAEARAAILTERAKAARGEQDAIDGHAMFVREKFAVALALLDGRVDVDAEDWRLSGIAAEVSRRTREWVAGQLAGAADLEAEERGRLLGVTYSASEDEKAQRAAKRANRLGRWVLDKLEAGPVSQRDLDRAVASRDRIWLRGVLEQLHGAGAISRDDEGRWVRQ